VQSDWLIVVYRVTNCEAMSCFLAIWISRTLQVTRFVVKAQPIRHLVYFSDTDVVISFHKERNFGECESYELFRA